MVILRLLVWWVFLAVFGTSMDAQSGLLIQRRSDPGKVVNIRFHRNYRVSTDSAEWRGQVRSHTNTSLDLMTHGADAELVTIYLASITELERGNFYAGAGAVFLAGGAFCLFAAPVAWALEGGEQALGYLAGAGLGLVIGVPFLLLSERFRYDLRNDWRWRVITPAPTP